MNVNWNHTKTALLSLEKHLQCSICKKLPDDPHLLWCKHSFCKGCISGLPRCPECSYPVKPQDIVRDIMLHHLLNAIKLSSEIVYSNPTTDGEDILKRKGGSKSNVINEKIANKVKKTNDGQKLVVKSHSTNRVLKANSSKKDDVLSREDNISHDEKNEKVNLESITKKNQGKLGRIEKPSALTPKRHDRKTSLLSKKGSIPESEKLLKSKPDIPLEFSIKCQPDIFKTPKSSSLSKSNTPKNQLSKSDTPKNSFSKCVTPKNVLPKSVTSKNFVTPKSSILFSAKKTQPTNKVNVKGETPLQIACRQGKLDLVRKLLEEGAEPNVKDYANWTPLCDAVGSGNVDVVRALLEAGAGVNTPSNLNTTALVEAVVRRDKPMAQLLLSYGADMHQRTTLNNTALSIADEEMKGVLMSVGDIVVQPYPRVRSSARTILAAKLSPDNIDQLMALCQKFNLSLSTVFTEDVTHIVVEKTEKNLCYGSVMVMMGILHGCSVVGTDWITACLVGNEVLSAEGFEPDGTDDYPDTDVFLRARLNQEHLLPRLFDGCHISLQHDQVWPESHKLDVIALIQTGGAVYLPRQCDAERIPLSEQTVMFHAPDDSPLALVSHIILYQPGPSEPLLKYNMAHIKTFSVTWFVQCIKTFTLA